MRTAAYARYSSDQQREASIEDQLRNVRNVCTARGWPMPEVYSDAAISGSRQDRKDYLRLMEDARAKRFDVLLVDDLSRLSRDQIEVARAVRMLKHWGIRLLGVSDGIDTERKGHKIEVGLRGLMGELYLDDLADKTYRGLMGQALKGNSAGGLPYGYRAVAVEDGRTREVREDQAKWVRWIFEQFNGGASPRAIAVELNRMQVPSARGSTWVVSAIYGDKRGIGILSNPIYVGRWIWNRSHWVKHPVTGRRQRQERPESEWIITQREDLRIVADEAWSAVQGRQRGVRARTRAAQARSGASARGGAGPKYLFSGLLRCGTCGGSIVVVDRYRYGCGTNKDRGQTVCENAHRVARTEIENRLLEGIKTDLLSEASFRVFESEARAALKTAQHDLDAPKERLRQALRERDNIMAAIRQGIITPSTKAALEAAEAAVVAFERECEAAQRYEPTQMLPRAREIWRGMVQRLAELDDLAGAREVIRELLGEIKIVTEAGGWVAELNGGMAAASEISLVAGGRYLTNLTRSIRIPLATSGRGL